MTDGPLLGPFPQTWEWIKARGGSPDYIDRWKFLTDDDREALTAHRKAWDAWRRRQEARQRAALRATLPHPNWQNRQPTCYVSVPGPVVGGMGVITKAKQSPWLRSTKHCGEGAVAWDGTDRRAVGYLYGACAFHLLRAIYDDGTRTWIWDNGTPVDPNTLDAELVVRALT